MRLLLVGATLAVAYAVVAQPVGCNQTAHYGLVQALWDGTPRIDRYHQETCDKSFIGGHYYAAKAPGLALLTEPWYALVRAAGAVPENAARAEAYPAAMLGMPRRAIWQVRLWGAMLPALALVLAAGLVAERLQPRSGVPVAATLGLGTLLLPFATEFFAHALSAALGFGAFALLFLGARGRREIPRALAAGLSAGLAVVVEFPLALIAAALGAYVLARKPRARRFAAYALGVLAGALPLMAFNWWAFGSPVELAYENAVVDPGSSGHDVVGANEEGFFGITLPSPSVAVDLLFSPRGLLVLTPVLALGGLGAVLLHRAGRRAEAFLVGLLPVAFLVYNAAYTTPFGGNVPGPRFLLPAIPFLAVALAPVFARRPLTASALAVVSAGAMVVATAAEPRLGSDDTRSWLRRWADGDFTHTVVTFAGGGHGWLAIAPFVAASVAVAAVALASVRGSPSRVDAATAVVSLIAWVVVLTAAPDLLGIGRWGEAAVVAVVVAAALAAANAGSVAVLGGAPLLLLLTSHFATHTKQALLVAAMAIAATLLLGWLGSRKLSGAR